MESRATDAASQRLPQEKKAAPEGAAEFREETSKNAASRITYLLRCTN